MIISVSTQISLVIFSLLAGIFTGILFDIYRMIRGFKNLNKYITFVEDLLFWILASILVFLFLLYTNYAYVSIYIYLLIAIGVCLYIKFISKLFLVLEFNSIRFISKVLRVIVKTVFFPIQAVIYELRHKPNRYKNKKLEKK